MSCRRTHCLALALGATILWAVCAPVLAAETLAMPAGVYVLDNRHTSVTFKISHLGFSYFTGRFDRVEGSCDYNPVSPEQSKLDVTVYPASIDTNDAELDETLRGQNWFDVLGHPRATFRATRIERVGETHAKITGDFTLRNVTHRLTLDAELVGTGALPFSETKVMGFRATGKFNRSDYGMANLEPMIGDEITLQIETEFDKDM